MSMKSLGLTLTLAIALMTLGYANPSFAKGKTCDENDTRPKCTGDDPPDPNSSATFTVSVFLDGDTVDDGIVTVTEAKTGGNRQSLNGSSVHNLDHVDVSQLPEGCGAIFGAPPASFSISTAKIPKSSLSLTFAVARIYDFTAFTEALGTAQFALSFVPDNLSVLSALFPTTTSNPVNLVGSVIEVGVVKGADRELCSGPITQNWTITVTLLE